MSIWGKGIETSSPPVLPIISPWVMYLRRSVLIFPRTICLNRFASRSILRTTAVRPRRWGTGDPLGTPTAKNRALPQGTAGGARELGGPTTTQMKRSRNRRGGWRPVADKSGRSRSDACSAQQIVFLTPSEVQTDDAWKESRRCVDTRNATL